MIAEFFDLAFNPISIPTLQFAVQRYSGHAVGGYEQAEIKASGPVDLLRQVHRMLGYYVIIRNENNTSVWFGRITQTVTTRGKRQRVRSLDDMYNRIAVAYSYTDGNGASQRGTTAYADDTNSQGLYGVKEQLQSLGDMDDAQATALRDDALTTLSAPIKNVQLTGQGEPGGSLLCKGLWDTTAWRIYNQPSGVAKHDVTGTYEHLLGWGKTSTGIAFESGRDGIHDIDGKLSALRKDDKIQVSGAANGGNNGTFTIEQATNNDASQYIANTISFEVTDDIKDSANGLGFVQSTQLIAVSGSSVSGNNRAYFSKDDLAADHITVNPATVANSGAGPAITIAQGHSVLVNGSLTTEYPGASVTLKAYGTIVAQSFTLPVNGPFLVKEVYVRLKKVGAPSDNVQVFIEADSSGSPTNVSLESASVVGSSLADSMEWVKFTFTGALSLSYGVTYWLVVWRTGANSATDYYMLDLSEDATYASGACKLWDGSTWQARTPAADMPFQVWAHRETTAQISDMLTTAGQFFVAQDIQVASGRTSRQYRDQDQTAQAEVETLLKAGINGGRRMLASVTPDKVVHVFQEPTYNAALAPLLDDDNKLLNPSGMAKWEPGKLPFGQWVTLTDELPDDAAVFIERAEYDATSGAYTALEPKGAPNPWDVVNLV